MNPAATRPSGGLLLALDTAGERCSACLLDLAHRTVLAEAEPAIGRGHAEALMDVVAGVLAQGKADYGDRERIAVCVGPGSFTGIRVAVSAARGLALALKVPLVGVDALEALAAPHLGQGAAVLVVQDARRGELYAALYDSEGRTLQAPAARQAGALADVVQAAAAPLLVAGGGSALAAEALAGRPLRVVSAGALPAIADVARIGAGRSPGSPVSPLYLRAADAKPQRPSGLVGPGSSSNPSPALR